MQQDWLNALAGGVLIGIAVSLMLLFNGRVTGVSGILNNLLSFKKSDRLWRFLFLLGLFVGGLVLHFFKPEVFQGQLSIGVVPTVVAGVLVGFGTALGNGCTSGHGVCGVSRLSVRSIVATLTFMIAGILVVALIRQTGVLS